MHTNIPADFNPPWMKRMPKNFPMINGIELAKAALPIFGGTSTETKNESSSENSNESSNSENTQSNANSGGGDSATEITPEKFQELQTQLAQAVSKTTELQTALDGYTSKEQEAQRAALSREDALTQDLTSAQQTIDKMDQVIKRLAVVNAIQGNENLQFHNVDDVISKLDNTAYELEVDLENGRATASGIENELSRIAKDFEYLVKKPIGENEQKQTRTPRGTGNPPGPRPTNQSAATRRGELEAKWPVIRSTGRAALG